jgi:hypothetical protein
VTDPLRDVLKEAYAAVGSYYREFEKVNRNLFEGSYNVGDVDRVAQVVGQSVMNTLKAANVAARKIAEGGGAGRANAGGAIAFVVGRRQIRVAMNPFVLDKDSMPRLWPLRQSKGRAELSEENMRLVPHGEGKLILSVRHLPEDLPAGSYFGPITEGVSDNIIATVFVTVETADGEETKKSARRQGRKNGKSSR